MSIGDIKRKAAQAMSFPPDAISGVSSLTLSGGCEILLYGCRSVAEYGDREIKVIMCDTTVTVYGECMRLRTFCGDRMYISGRAIYGAVLGKGIPGDMLGRGEAQ